MISDQIKIIIDGVPGVWMPDVSALEPDAPLSEGYLSPHFRIAEFDCNHCGLYGETIAPELIKVLEDCRAHFNCPITINSGVRCEQHNDAVGGVTNSRHLYTNADAADIAVAEASPRQVHDYLVTKYPNKYGIGKYDSFTHVDTRPGGPARW